METHKGIVLALCNLTDNAVQDWADAGYSCWSVDLQHPAGISESINNIGRIGADVTRFVFPFGWRVKFVMAFPPCTDMAVSGARWFATKGLDALADSLKIVAACQRIVEACNCPYYLEHPVSTLSTYWRKPNHSFDPCDFAGYLADPSEEAYTKKTNLWTGGGFIMPQPKPVEPVLGSKMHLLPPSADRANLRSATPRGFSRAVFEANSGLVAASVV